jgi:hypothetical protein
VLAYRRRVLLELLEYVDLDFAVLNLLLQGTDQFFAVLLLVLVDFRP